MPAVKIGTSRQVVIPKKIHDEIGLGPGDYLDVELRDGKVILTPKKLVDKSIEERLKESIEDVKAGRVSRRYKSARTFVRDLRRDAKKLKKKS